MISRHKNVKKDKYLRIEKTIKKQKNILWIRKQRLTPVTFINWDIANEKSEKTEADASQKNSLESQEDVSSIMSDEKPYCFMFNYMHTKINMIEKDIIKR